jgi:hypothetical protein
MDEILRLALSKRSSLLSDRDRLVVAVERFRQYSKKQTNKELWGQFIDLISARFIDRFTGFIAELDAEIEAYRKGERRRITYGIIRRHQRDADYYVRLSQNLEGNCLEYIFDSFQLLLLDESQIILELLLTRNEAFLYEDFQVLLDEFIKPGDKRTLEIFDRAVQTRLR